MHPEAPDDPLRMMIVDRVERSDGRYLIYYSWPDAEGSAPAVPPGRNASEASPTSGGV